MKFKIEGMHCKSCKMLIEDILDDINVQVVSLTVNEAKQEGVLEVANGDKQQIINAIEAEGDYKVNAN